MSSRSRNTAAPAIGLPSISTWREFAGAQDAAEGFAAAPQRVERRFHFARRIGLEPGAERQEPAYGRLTRQLSRVAEDDRLGLLFAPGHDHLRIAQEDRIGPVEFVLQARDLAPRLIERSARAHAGSQVRDRNDHGEDQEAEREGERGDLVALEACERMKVRTGCRRRCLGEGLGGKGDGSESCEQERGTDAVPRAA